MTELPSGTVTFLFTDIERSTESVAELGDARYATALQTHRGLLRPAFERHNGVEVGTEGDAFFVAFARAGDAVSAALEGQRALEGHEWDRPLRVRMGLHTGEVLVQEGDYIGHDVHKAKRICDAGNGGQVLLSEATMGLVSGHLPEGAFLADLGHHRLKDLGEPQRIYQVAADGLRTDFPALRSLDAFTQNLPPQRTAFIGREQEITEVRKLLEVHRLVTLTGVGGCGKTRLAVQVGAEELDRFADGVFIAELAPLSDGALIARTVANALGMTLATGPASGTPVSVEELVIEHLGRRTCLLIMDNCEHLLDACADFIDIVLGRCPNVTLLATSREGLDVEGEQSWRVPSLSVPDDPSQARDSEAVSLFKARAQAVLPAFELTPDNVGAVTEICTRLDGIPLAIELAASRVTHLSPQQIHDRLDDMFKLLTGGRRRVQRQQTLEASLDWSYELLSEPEQILLRRLAVFAGSFGLEPAEQICADDRVPKGSVLDLLRSLVDKSLVSAQASEAETRYRLLEPVRLYASEHLRRAGEAETFRERHRDRYVEWVESFPLEDAYMGLDALDAYETEHDNLRTALDWSAAQQRADLVARLATHLVTLWWNGGHADEGDAWFTKALADEASLPIDLQVACYAGLTICSMMRVEPAGMLHADRTIELAGDEASGGLVVAMALKGAMLSVLAETTRSEEVAADARAAVEGAVSAGSRVGGGWESYAIGTSGGVEMILRNIKGCVPLFRQAASANRSPAMSRMANAASLAVALHIVGDHDAALEHARFARDLESDQRLGFGANALALALAGLGRSDEAKTHLARVVRAALGWGIALWLNEVLVFCGAVAFLDGDSARASRLLALGRELGGARALVAPFRTQMSYALYLHYLPLVREALGPEDARKARDEARAMSVDQAIAYALDGLEPA
jgi:predicted ATPase/class 3 adenylate cyclase